VNKEKDRQPANQSKRIDRIFFPIVIAVLLIIMVIYGQNIFSQWSILVGDYKHNIQIVTEMSKNITKNTNLATRMFETQAVEGANDVLVKINDYYDTNKDDLLKKDLSEFLSPIQDLWIDVSVLDNQATVLNDKKKSGDDSYKFADISGARILSQALIKKAELSGQWITISTQTDVVIKYEFSPTRDAKYIIEIAANIVEYNSNIDVYDIGTYANDLVKNYNFVDSAYVFNTEGFSTSSLSNGYPQLISDDLKVVFDQALNIKTEVKRVRNSTFGFSDTTWAIPVNVSSGSDANVYYNYVLILSFNNHDSLIYFYAQAGLNLFVALFAMAVILLLILRNRTQYLNPLSRLSTSIIAASNGNYDKITQIKGASIVKRTITEYNVLLERIKKAIITRDSAYFQTINALASAIDASDKYTGGHCERVMALSVLMGEKLGLSRDDLNALRYGAILHDIGKIGIDTRIVNKPGRLTDDEYMTIKAHPSIGLHIISNIEYLNKAKHILSEHHERWDGTGYPAGLKGDEADILARITSLADSYDAMSSERSYRSKLSKETIISEIRKNTGTQFDPKLAQLFIEMLEEKETVIINEIYKTNLKTSIQAVSY
jgi:putative nucleotidyltransferase with HDIG domain